MVHTTRRSGTCPFTDVLAARTARGFSRLHALQALRNDRIWINLTVWPVFLCFPLHFSGDCCCSALQLRCNHHHHQLHQLMIAVNHQLRNWPCATHEQGALAAPSVLLKTNRVSHSTPVVVVFLQMLHSDSSQMRVSDDSPPGAHVHWHRGHVCTGLPVAAHASARSQLALQPLSRVNHDQLTSCLSKYMYNGSRRAGALTSTY